MPTLTCIDGVRGQANSSSDSATMDAFPVLQKYFGTIIPLATYLDALLPSRAHSIVTENDPESFRSLLETTLVAFQSPDHKIPQMHYHLPQNSQSEVFFSLYLATFY